MPKRDCSICIIDCVLFTPSNTCWAYRAAPLSVCLSASLTAVDTSVNVLDTTLWLSGLDRPHTPTVNHVSPPPTCLLHRPAVTMTTKTARLLQLHTPTLSCLPPPPPAPPPTVLCLLQPHRPSTTMPMQQWVPYSSYSEAHCRLGIQCQRLVMWHQTLKTLFCPKRLKSHLFFQYYSWS